MLNENDRLTHEHANGWFVKTGQPVAKYWSSANKARLIQRVGEYEDTGYSPEEIKGFLAKYKNKDDEDRQNNRVGKYLDPAEVKQPQATAAAPAGGGFVPGAF